MNKIFLLTMMVVGSGWHTSANVAAQTNNSKVASARASAPVEHYVDLAAAGQCREALPGLKRSANNINDKELKYRAEMALVRCAMSLNQDETTVQELLKLNREFPDDPQVLYISTHYYSELGSRSAQHLAAVAPASPQAHQLRAESMESQERWDDAAAEYTHILDENQKLPGIHFRLGRIALSRPQTAATVEEAHKQLQAELAIDPTNAAAEFFLGEIARQAAQWTEAIARFTAAAKLDPTFAEAYLALGMSLNSAERFAEAIAPLEKYIKIVEKDPAGHYQLSVAYARTGRKQQAARELSIQQELEKQNQGGTRKSMNGATPN